MYCLTILVIVFLTVVVVCLGWLTKYLLIASTISTISDGLNPCGVLSLGSRIWYDFTISVTVLDTVVSVTFCCGWGSGSGIGIGSISGIGSGSGIGIGSISGIGSGSGLGIGFGPGLTIVSVT